MTSELEQRKRDLLHNLRHACAAFDAHNPKDVNGRGDILIRVRRVEDQLRELGVGPAEIAEYNLQQSAAEARTKQLLRFSAYKKTGIVPR